jgi:LytR cell envelope-related transcriptional attenuator
VNQPVGPGQGPGSGDGIHTLKALVLIVVVVLIGWAVLDHTTKPSHASAAATSPTTAPPSATTVPATPTTTVAVIPPSQIKLQVLNGVGSGQLAAEWSNKLKTNPGYNTLAPNDATTTVAKSEIYIVTPGYLREADALAVTVGLTSASINPTAPPPASAPIPASARSAANLVLVIGPDLAGTA